MKLPSFDRNDGREPISYEQHTHNSATAVAFNPGTPSKMPMSYPKGNAAKHKMEKVMHEFKTGALKSSDGSKVTSRAQAIAIGLSEARAAEKGKRHKK